MPFRGTIYRGGRKSGAKNRGKKPPPRGANPGRVACLAPGVPDHMFDSTDKINDRYCPRCRARMAKAGPSPRILLYPVPTPACWD